MTLEDFLSRFSNTFQHDILRFLPESLLCIGILTSLLLRLFRRFDRIHVTPIALLLVIAGLILVVSDLQSTTLFNNQLCFDLFSTFLRAILLLATAFVLILGRTTGLPDREDSADFTTLVLGAALGMMLMVSANSLLMVFVAVEMASLPSYVLAGFQKNKTRASEAALKYVVYGAAASGVMLYGITLLAGRCGSLNLANVGLKTWEIVHVAGFDLPLAMGYLFLLTGLGFKLAVFPFQFWLPDVFEGALAEVGAVLAVASKAAAFGLLTRLLYYTVSAGLGHVSVSTIGVVLVCIAMLTATLGNLAALSQTNLKRMLAYSTIAHAGYMLMGVACLTRMGNSALLFYLVGYLPMTIGAFAVVAILRNLTGSEELDAARGLLKRSPWVAIPLIVFFFSLLGLPPFVGFVGKFQLFHAIYATASYHPSATVQTLFYIAIGVGVLNTVVSAGYYLKVLKVVAFDDPAALDEKGNANELGESFAHRAYLGLLAVAVLVGGIAWNPLAMLADRAAGGLGQ